MPTRAAHSQQKKTMKAARTELSWGRRILLCLLCFAGRALQALFTIPVPILTACKVRTGAKLRKAVRSAEHDPKPPSEFRLQLGHAIDTLRIDAAQLFDHGRKRPDLSLFSDDVTFAVQSMPSLSLEGLDMYNRTLRLSRWSVKSMRNSSQMKIMTVYQPIDNMVYMRWQLRIRPKDMLLATAAQSSFWDSTEKVILLEGLSKYEFHHSTALIVRHTVEFTNPPLYLSELPQSFKTLQDFLLQPMPSGVTAPRFEHDTLSFSSLPAACEDDFECNNGTANYPFQCLHPHECISSLPEIFIMGRYCCEPGLSQPIVVAVPVPSQ